MCNVYPPAFVRLNTREIFEPVRAERAEGLRRRLFVRGVYREDGLAGQLTGSLRRKILPLGDGVVVYSGRERLTNPLLTESRES